jgi:hypothetical protein
MRAHGTRSCYVFGPEPGGDCSKGCRCEDCKRANARYASFQQKRRRLDRDDGRFARPYVDASRARAIQGDAGFVDLVLARRGSVVFAELKTERGKLTDEQIVWGSAFIAAYGGAPTNPLYQVWTPAHWRNGTIEAVLA